MMRYVIAVVIFASLTASVLAQGDVERRLAAVENRVSALEAKANLAFDEVNKAASFVFVCFVCGVFCALWAQNSARNAWLWFFLGFFFNGLTLLVLLAKNASDQNTARQALASKKSGLEQGTR